MGAQWWGTGFDPDGGGLWTGEVILHWISSRGTHDLAVFSRDPSRLHCYGYFPGQTGAENVHGPVPGSPGHL